MQIISKQIQTRVNTKKIRYPHIVDLKKSYGGFNVSDKCRIVMDVIANDNEYDRKYSHDFKLLVHAILKIGTLKACGLYSRLELTAIPWMFWNWIKMCDYHGIEQAKIEANRLKCDLIEKYKKKLENIIDDNEKRLGTHCFKNC